MLCLVTVGMEAVMVEKVGGVVPSDCDGWWWVVGRVGGAATFQSRLLPGPAANQYHFPVFEAGNYEVERLCDP